jgi:NADPH:quinone reductase-like Zn-dependent oxidoreductase
MQAARIHRFGGPERVKVEESPLPATKQGQALVRVKAAAVNPVDWMVRERIYNPEGMDRVPLTLGQDFAGIIESIAPGTRTSLKEGDEVFGETWGSFAEYVAVPVKDLVRKPASLDFIVAASIPMPALTAWQVVIDTARASARQTFLIHGASGGVGSFAAQFAKWKGATVIATASRPSFAFLRKIGVDEVIDYKKERFEKKVNDVDVVIDPIGGDTQKRSWSVLREGGLLINLIGEIDRRAARRARVRAIDFAMEYDTNDLRQIARLVARGVVTPHITKVMPLTQARRALDLNQNGRSHGKIVLKVA